MVYIEIRPWTRLGNWLFQCAAALAIDESAVACIEDSGTVEKFRSFQNFFGDIRVVTKKPETAKVYRQPRFAYDPIVGGEGDMVLSGFFQSPKFFKNARERILRAYGPSEEKIEELRIKAKDWIPLPQVTAIHVRRGDYLKLQYMHPFVGKRYLKDAISTFPDCKDFVVFSDDIPWCKKFFPKTFPDKRFYFSDGGSVVDDIYLQSLCQNNIISNSSFSWWAAWLNRNPTKRVIAPSKWFGFVKTPEYWKDIYDDGWEIVHNRYSVGSWLVAHYSYLEGKFRIAAVKTLRRIGLRK